MFYSIVPDLGRSSAICWLFFKVRRKNPGTSRADLPHCPAFPSAFRPGSNAGQVFRHRLAPSFPPLPYVFTCASPCKGKKRDCVRKSRYGTLSQNGYGTY